MSCYYKTYFDIEVEWNRVNEVIEYFRKFNISFLSVVDLNPYDKNSNNRVRFNNYCWLNNNVDRIKRELKPLKIYHSIYENCLNGELVEVRIK